MNKLEKYEILDLIEDLDLFKTVSISNYKCSNKKDGVHIYNALQNDFVNEKILNKTQTKSQELNENEYMLFLRRRGDKSIITLLRTWDKKHNHKKLIICWNKDVQWIELDYRCPFCKQFRLKCECETKESFRKENAL